MSDEKKKLGQKILKERKEIKKTLSDLKGKNVTTLTKAELESLVMVLCLLANIVDEKGVIKPL